MPTADLNLHSHFQPIYSLAHRRTVGFEALLRAEQDGNPVPPQQAYLGHDNQQERHEFDIRVSSAHLARFAGFAPPQNWLFLNVDASTLSTPARTQALISALQQSGVPAACVVLEILEHALEADQGLIEGSRMLRAAGFLIAIDDFGAGHSNLDRVCLLEPDLVKFDRNLLRSAVTQPRTRNLLTKLVHLVHEIGALVVVEGVETEADVLVALESGCDLVQGYYVARPAFDPDKDETITRRIDTRWDELMVRELMKRKLTRRQIELARQAFVQSAIALMQGTAFTDAAKPMLTLPDVIRCFLLDSTGRQIGRNLNTREAPSLANPKFAPLANTTGAIWSRRPYFQHAIDQPGVLYMSEPYLSMTDTRSCITLSMAIEIDEVLHVLCADVLVARQTGPRD
ncbi:sensor domain-containing phosphodiesterase [Craterilacuibacter sp.]|uniref:sensor domain-containing phosphodiesterase n=1 Tax=Craterilacuibacter sp. TaxID=2870909 RepID=UPI003F2FDE8F